MKNNFRGANIQIKCKECGSTNLKKRKNFSHGSGTKAKTSYVCNDCKSTSVQKEAIRRGFRRN